jgi:methionyl-tRNA formyltransferase
VGIKLAFMGTASFAVPTLNQLFEAGYVISGVITQPDKPSGRGQSVQWSPVKKRAFDLHLPVFQPNALKSEEASELIRALSPELVVVVAYGRILPPWLLRFPHYGCINLHGSLLPKYRGAAPVHWAIANGEQRTGVCSMLLDEGLDTGPVYLCDETAIERDETSPELYDRLAALGGPLMLRTLRGVEDGTLEPKPQEGSQATFAPLLKKEHGFLDWFKSAAEIHNRVRAFNPWPGTVTRFRNSIVKILRTSPSASAEAGVDRALSGRAGSIELSKRSLGVVCGDDKVLDVLLMQAQGRKPVSGLDFANGMRIQPGEKFQPLLDN